MMKMLNLFAAAALALTVAAPAFAEMDTPSDHSAPPAAMESPNMASPGAPLRVMYPHQRTITTTRTTTVAHGIVPDATTDIMYVPSADDMSVGTMMDADVMADLNNPSLVDTDTTVIIEEPAPIGRRLHVLH